MSDKQAIALKVNDTVHEVLVDPRHTLLHVLREQLNLVGTKCGCNHGVCGTCTVLVDDVPVRACLTLAVAGTDRDITTIEGIAKGGDWIRYKKPSSNTRPYSAGFAPRHDHLRQGTASRQSEPDRR